MSENSEQQDMSPKQAPKARFGGGMRALLVGSLTLNLLVAGLVVGALVFDGPKGPPGGKGRGGDGPRAERSDPSLGPLGKALPQEQRRLASEQLRREGGSREEGRRVIAMELGQMLEIVRSEPFDGAALEAVMESQSARFSERGALGRQIIIERLEAMSPEGRQEFADKLERGFEKAMRRDGPGKP